ncbi:hypothetical protein R1flu_022476 [Riccia fluitans]|uniref:Uncharacterized protein n=1 Tax=Riccia fluitans TaxID=41844 RepID=A0ABD1XPT7_9MARC
MGRHTLVGDFRHSLIARIDKKRVWSSSLVTHAAFLNESTVQLVVTSTTNITDKEFDWISSLSKKRPLRLRRLGVPRGYQYFSLLNIFFCFIVSSSTPGLDLFISDSRREVVQNPLSYRIITEGFIRRSKKEQINQVRIKDNGSVT